MPSMVSFVKSKLICRFVQLLLREPQDERDCGTSALRLKIRMVAAGVETVEPLRTTRTLLAYAFTRPIGTMTIETPSGPGRMRASTPKTELRVSVVSTSAGTPWAWMRPRCMATIRLA